MEGSSAEPQSQCLRPSPVCVPIHRLTLMPRLNQFKIYYRIQVHHVILPLLGVNPNTLYLCLGLKSVSPCKHFTHGKGVAPWVRPFFEYYVCDFTQAEHESKSNQNTPGQTPSRKVAADAASHKQHHKYVYPPLRFTAWTPACCGLMLKKRLEFFKTYLLLLSILGLHVW